MQKIIKKGEKIFKTDLTYLAKGGIWLTLGQITISISGVLVTVVLANLLSEETFGTYKFILSLSGIVTIFSLTGMGIAITRATSRGNEGVLKQGLKTSLKWNIAITTLSFCIAGYYFLNNNDTIALAMIIVGILSPLIQSFSLYTPFVEGKKDFKTRSFFSISFSLFPALLLVATVFITKNPIFIVLAFFFGRAFIHIIHYVITLKKYKPNNNIDSHSATYSKHLSAMNILGGLAFQLDKILIFHYLGAAQLALYAIALAVPQQLRYFNRLIKTMALPRFSQRSVKSLKQSMFHKSVLLFGITSIVVVLYILAAPFIYALMFPKYIDAVIYSQVFSLIMLFFPSMLFKQALTAHMQKKQLYILQTFLPTLKIILLFILLPIYGIWGAIISMFCTETIRLILVIYYFYNIKETTV